MAGKIRVRYKGIADHRIITAKDVEPHGIVLDRDLSWNRGNLFRLDIEANDKLEEILRHDGAFTVTKLKDDGTEEVEVQATATDDEGDTIVDAESGATTKSRKARA